MKVCSGGELRREGAWKRDVFGEVSCSEVHYSPKLNPWRKPTIMLLPTRIMHVWKARDVFFSFKKTKVPLPKPISCLLKYPFPANTALLIKSSVEIIRPTKADSVGVRRATHDLQEQPQKL